MKWNKPEDIYQRSISAHLGYGNFKKLQESTVLIAGMGGGSNIAELLVRKGVGNIIIADFDVYEIHNVRQRGASSSTVGKEKVTVMRSRLLDINPSANIQIYPEGVTTDNVIEMVSRADYIVDMLDFSAFLPKVIMSREAREAGKFIITAPSVVNGALLFIFKPDGPSLEELFGLDLNLDIEDQGEKLMHNLIKRFPLEAPRNMYMEASRGERSIPLDAVGVDQAAVMAVAALENLILDRTE
ncbi:MAG: ThiF family adenylyltransferase, partial [Planctomycetes bacterium]|nr:ThiF family adenylyltransferase [Planctomycetota bacterium]